MMHKPTAKELALAYRTVFGQEGTRTEAQQIVWNDLVLAYQFFPCYQYYAGQPAFDTYRAAIHSGRVEVARNIFDNVTMPLNQIDRDPVVERGRATNQPQ